jgi:hypothetical protein
MEDFILFVDKKVDLVRSIEDVSRNITFSKGDYVSLKNSTDMLKIVSIIFPVISSKIILLENTKSRKRFWVDPSEIFLKHIINI